MDNDELRIAIAKARGWKVVADAGNNERPFYILHPDVNITVTTGHPTAAGAWNEAFSSDSIPLWDTDIAAAWKLMNEIVKSGDGFVTLYAGVYPDNPLKTQWTLDFGMRQHYIRKHKTGQIIGEGETAPIAICRAWLQWKRGGQMNDAQTTEISADGKAEPGLEICPFCAKPFILHSPKVGVTAFQHYSEGCPLHEAEMQFVNLPIETMTAMLNHRPVEHVLARCVQSEGERADRAEAERDSETRWANEYHSNWQGALETIKRLEEAAAHNGEMAQAEKVKRLEAEEALKFHPRAAKLMRKRKNFVVVAVDEPYFIDVYRTIRAHEQQAGRWTDDDERQYLATVWG